MIEEYSKKRKINHFVLIDENIERFVYSTGLEKDVAKGIFVEFISYLPGFLNEIEDALNNTDFEKLGKLAHQLKGSPGNLRITSIIPLSFKNLDKGLKYHP